MSEIVNSSLKFNSYVHRSYTAPKKPKALFILLLIKANNSLVLLILYQLELCTLKRESPIWLLCRGNIPWSSAVLNYEAMQLKRMISHRCDPSAPGPPRHGNKAMQQFSSKQTRMTTCSTSVSSTLSERDGCQSFPIASIDANTENIEHQTLGPRTVHASASAQMEGCGLQTEPERNSKGNNDRGMQRGNKNSGSKKREKVLGYITIILDAGC